MITIASGEWIVDLGKKTCWNINTKMVVEFQKSGMTYIGKVKVMPIKLMAEWAKLRHGEQLIERAVMEAEEVFLRAFIEREIETGENEKKK